MEVVSTTSTQRVDPNNGLGSLDGDAFLNLMVTQLRYQNPLEPLNGAEMLAQTAQFTQVETLKEISEFNQQILGLQQTTVALGVVGKEITAIALDGSAISGTVREIRFTIDGPMLDVDGIEIPLGNVVSVQPPEDASDTN